MKKPNKKQIQKYLLNVNLYFKELIDSIIYYDLNEMDEEAYEIIVYIEDLSNIEIFDFLLNDLKNRTISDFEAYFYCKLWWALIYEQDDDIINMIVSSVKVDNNIMLHDFLNHSINQLNNIDDDDDVGENKNKLYIEAILKKINS